MTIKNPLLSYAFDNHVAHGAIVHIDEGVAEFFSHRSHSPDVARLMREAMAAMPLLATHLRFEGRINLQFQGDRRMELLVSQIDHHLNVRTMAKAPTDLAGGFTELLYGGILALMLEPAADNVPASQAVVLIEGESLSQALEGYFKRSEQLPTLLRLAVRGDKLAGFMLQRMPLESAQGNEADWEHLLTLASTLGDDELLDTDGETILRRLFAEDPVRTFEPRSVEVVCRCSRAGISRMLLSLGQQEVDEILQEQGKVSVTCEFCGQEHVFTPHQAHELFRAADESGPDSEVRH